MAGRNLGNFDAVIGNLFLQLMLANVYMFEFSNERWQVLGKQPDSLLIVVVDD